MANTQWEVVVTYTWGSQTKFVSKTRKEARKMLKLQKDSSPAGNNYIKSIDLYKVTILPGLSELVQEGVYTYKKVR